MGDIVRFDAFGETLEVYFDRVCWVSPTNGMQHGRIEDAARCEVEALVHAGGDCVYECSEEIDEAIERAVKASQELA